MLTPDLHADILRFMKSHRWAVEATATTDARPQAAPVIGGWVDGEMRTLQYEGVADFPEGAELERLQADYFDAFPDGPSRMSWPGITYVRISPMWMRLSDFSTVPPTSVDVTMANH